MNRQQNGFITARISAEVGLICYPAIFIYKDGRPMVKIEYSIYSLENENKLCDIEGCECKPLPQSETLRRS